MDLRLDLCDRQGICTNADPIVQRVGGNEDWQSYTYDFTGRFEQAWDNKGEKTGGSVDATAINEMVFFINPGRSFTGDVELRVGD